MADKEYKDIRCECKDCTPIGRAVVAREYSDGSIEIIKRVHGKRHIKVIRPVSR